ncbi:hypothetical protein T492DRAFT_836169 [Pavlovales sp. CCMP2436]|nr:hypothetical protein T492DRAFT_836169 [Pavlovales sp. CCMP2436]
MPPPRDPARDGTPRIAHINVHSVQDESFASRDAATRQTLSMQIRMRGDARARAITDLFSKLPLANEALLDQQVAAVTCITLKNYIQDPGHLSAEAGMSAAKAVHPHTHWLARALKALTVCTHCPKISVSRTLLVKCGVIEALSSLCLTKVPEAINEDSQWVGNDYHIATFLGNLCKVMAARRECLVGPTLYPFLAN